MNRSRVLIGRDQGAIALIVTVLVAAFFIIAASTIDFGQAYVTKRQLSTSADSAALAAAQYYASLPGSCGALASAADPTDAATAQSIANNYMTKNFPGATPGTISARCSPDNKQLWVSFSNSATNGATFGQVAGVYSITTNRATTANVFVPSGVAGALPYALCFSDAQAIADNPNTVERAVYPSACGDYPGDWYTVDCPEDSGNTSQNNLAKYCKDEITTIDATDGDRLPDTDTAATEAYVATQCNATTGWSSDCLRGNSGQIRGTISDFWKTLVGTTVTLPVIFDHTITGTGSQTYFPIVGFLTAEVCGYHWGPERQQITSPASDRCVADNTNNYTDNQLANNSNYVLLIKSTLTIGGSSAPSQCAEGDPQCATGPMSYALIK